MGESTEPRLAFGLFVSCVADHPVARFGTKILIGADRDANDARKITYRPKDIVAIPTGEANRYAREYQRAIDDGELVAHTEDEWKAQNAQREKSAATREKLEREPAAGTPARKE